MSDRRHKYLEFLAGHAIQDTGSTDFRDIPKMGYHEFKIGHQKVLTTPENNIIIDPGDCLFCSILVSAGILLEGLEWDVTNVSPRSGA